MRLLHLYHSIDKLVDGNNIIFCTKKNKKNIFKSYEKIFANMTLYYFDDINEGISFKSISDDKEVKLSYFKKSKNILILFPESNYDDIREISALSFLGVFGEINTEKQDYFGFWEILRENSDVINFELYFKASVRHFYWEKHESKIELSIVVPVYNVEKYINQCIDSLIEWEADYIEILAINDTSPDNCLDILNGYSAKDKRVRVITQPNGGCATARQKGLSLSNGRYVGFVDSDDFINPRMFKQLLKSALSGNYDVAYCGYNKIYEEDFIHCDAISEPCLREPYTKGVYDKKKVTELMVKSDVAIWRGIYKKSFLNDNNIKFLANLKMYDDLPFQKEVFLKGNSFISIPEHLYYYRLGRINQDVSCKDERLHVHFDIFHHLETVFKMENDFNIMQLLRKIKIDTHRYALSKIDDQYLDSYRKKAIEDLRRNSSFINRINLVCKTLFRKRF